MLHGVSGHGPAAFKDHNPLKALLPVGVIAISALLAAATMCRVDKQVASEKIVLRDSSQALAGIQNVLDLMGMVLKSFL